MSKTALEKLCDTAGSKAGFARTIKERTGRNLYPQLVDKWFRVGRIPAEWCLSVEQAFDGEVTRYEMRPDVFGSSPDRAA